MIRPIRHLLCLCLIVVAPPLLAWGQTGHRAIAAIAENTMQPETLKKARALLDGHDLAYVSTWADEIRSDPGRYGYSFNWHYTTWQDKDEHFHAADETRDTGFLLSQLERQLALLKDSKGEKSERAKALRFIVHLVGDLHQPLHVGGGNDMGGNTCHVTWFGKASNLHTVWDSGLIENNGLSYSELAAFSSQGRTATAMTAARHGDLRSWALESRNLRAEIYPPELVPSDKPGALSYCQESVASDAKPKLGYEYSYHYMPIVRDRLYDAGIRLALLLDDAL